MIIGITGGIASGKTICTDWFESKGIIVIDADIIAHQLTDPDGKALKRIAQTFENILLPDGRLNRAMLREIIFSSAREREKLESILHPLIREEILFQLQENKHHGEYQLLSAPLLFENKLDEICKKIIVVDIPIELQVSRACQRDNQDKEAIKKIIATQIPRSERLAKADFIVDNSKDLQHTYQQLALLKTTLDHLK